MVLLHQNHYQIINSQPGVSFCSPTIEPHQWHQDYQLIHKFLDQKHAAFPNHHSCSKESPNRFLILQFFPNKAQFKPSPMPLSTHITTDPHHS